ncbi:MAG: ABC-F family ATP-binding cassette domain-containing protein [Clostridia bacterium]|nr:ABC-F family ATP-binding cassette domain-containing protein [Clostridia bacterium]
MSVLAVHQGEKWFGERCLFRDVTFEAQARDRIGLVGCNGCGKTTLLRILTGQDSLTAGEVIWAKTARPGYLEQHTFGRSRRTLWEETLQVFEPLVQQEQLLARLSERLGGATEQEINEYNALRERFEAQGGLYFRSRARAALLGLGFDTAALDRPVSELSGGQRSRAAMGRLLLSNANVLLLDEPTNHLDVDAAEWLEEYLRDYNGAVIVVSHDRYFLDRVTGRTWEIADGRLYMSDGNYTAHRQWREKEAAVQAHHYQTEQRQIARMQESIRILKSFNREKSIRAAESKEKALDRLMQTAGPAPQKEQAFAFQFPVRLQSGREVLHAEQVSMGFDRPLFTGAQLHLLRGERVFLLGRNGCGKTTLLRGLLGKLPLLHGTVRSGAKVSIGYYDQTQQGLQEDKTVFDQIRDAYPRLSDAQVRGALAAFLFKGDDVFVPVSQLSGGEKARVLLLKLMLAGDNLLLLDEPTNHLDIRSREALEQALLQYDGTLLAVSHDRYFINRLATRVAVLTPDGIEDGGENYDAYLAARRPPEPEPPATQEPKKENLYLLRKQQAARARQAAGELRRVERQIADAEQRQAELTRLLEDPQTASDYVRASELTDQLSRLSAELEALMEQWADLAAQVEETQK